MNGDSQITGNDALFVLQYVANVITDVNESDADVNGDGLVSGNDALLILQYVAGMFNEFPAEENN